MTPSELQGVAASQAPVEVAIRCANVVFADLDLSDREFIAKVEFTGCVFERPLQLRNAKFQSDVFFRNCTFHGVDFTAAHFFGECNFGGSKFQGLADFYRAQFEGPAFFRPTDEPEGSRVQFHEEARFRDAHFFGEANFTGAIFHQGADFTRVRIDGAALFRPADDALTQRVEFHRPKRDANAGQQDEVTFRGARFGSEATFTRCVFDARLNFNAVKAEVYLMFAGTEFRDLATFRESSAPTVFLRRIEGPDRQPGVFASGLDARGFKYTRIFVEPETFTRLLAGEPWGPDRADEAEARAADRQPFLEFEAALRRMGLDHEADQVYLERQRQERRRYGKRFWKGDWARYVVSCVQWLLANYGISPKRLLFVPVLFLALGTVVFMGPGSVTANREPGEKAGKVEDRSAVTLDGLSALGVSVAQFLPIPVPGGVWYKPTRGWVGWLPLTFDAYASIQRIVGWIYVPLIAGFFAGLFRREAPKAEGGEGGE